MSAVITPSFRNKREVAAQLGTAIVGLAIYLVSQTIVMQTDLPPPDETISLTLADPTPIPPAPMVAPPPPSIQSRPVDKVPDQPKQIAPVVEAPAPVQQAVVAPPVQAIEKAEPIKTAAPVAQSNGVAEGLFAQDVKARIERKKIYPDTARDLGMSGEVEVMYELDRAGTLLRAEISTSSGYKLLDQAALKAVKSAVYKSFPEDAWLGVSSKMFRTKLVFSINQ